MAHMKKIIGWTAIALFAATLAGIWVLTEQNAVQTSLLSESTARVVEGQAASVQATGITGETQAGDGMTESTNPAASTVQPGRVGDQVHKIFVPGRHFDVIDLGFDAAGYVTAMLLVLLAAALVRHAIRPIGAHARR